MDSVAAPEISVEAINSPTTVKLAAASPKDPRHARSAIRGQSSWDGHRGHSAIS